MLKVSMKIFFIVILLNILSPSYSACSIDTAVMCTGDIDNGQNIFLNRNDLFITPFLKENYLFIPKFDFKK